MERNKIAPSPLTDADPILRSWIASRAPRVLHMRDGMMLSPVRETAAVNT